MIALDVALACEGWHAVGDAEDAARRAAASLLAVLPEPPEQEVSAALLLADDEAVRALNRDWRGLDKPTNVLSFPAPASPERPLPLGDVVLAFETTAREAAEDGKPLAHHAAHLVIHGLLHLLGHDHETPSGAAEMERIETAALGRLGIPDPHAAHLFDEDPGER